MPFKAQVQQSWQAILILLVSIAFLTYGGVASRTVNLYQVTFATKPHPVLDRLQDQVNIFGQNLEVLGLQENRDIGWRSGKRNFGVKLRELHQFLQRPELKPSDIVLFTDAYDVAMIGCQQEIKRRYQTLFTKPIVFGAETNCHPDPKLAEQYGMNLSGTMFPYLNSGLGIGRVWALRQCMTGYVYQDQESDQHFWTKQFLKRRDLIELDHGARLFLNTHGADQKDIVWESAIRRVTFLPTQTHPLMVHANGTDRSYLYGIIGRWTEPPKANKA